MQVMYVQRMIEAHSCYHCCSGTAIQQGAGLSNRSGNSRYPSLGDTLTVVLQGRDELCSATTENIVAVCRHTGKVSCVQCAATFVYFQEIKVFTGKQQSVS